MSTWHVYLLRCSDDTLYTGISTDTEKRLVCHNAGKGAKYTRSRLPVKLVWQETAASESIARKREIELKRWTRTQKLALIRSGKQA